MARGLLLTRVAAAAWACALVLACTLAPCLASSDETDSDDCPTVTLAMNGGATCPFAYRLDSAPDAFASAGEAVMGRDALGVEVVFIVGGTKGDGEKTSRVLTTPTGGFASESRVWTVIQTPTGLPPVSAHVLLAPTPTTLLVVSGSTAAKNANGFTYRSTDGGASWALVASDSVPQRFAASGACVNVTGYTHLFCYVVGGSTGPKLDAKDVWQTTDAGDTWVEAPGTVPWLKRHRLMVAAFGGKLFVAGGITVETTPPTPRRDAFFYTPVTGVWTQLTSAPPDALDIAAGYVAAFGNMAYFGMGASFETGFRENNYNMYSVDTSGVITLLSSCEEQAFQREDGVLVAMPLEVGFQLMALGGQVDKGIYALEAYAFFETVPCHKSGKMCNCNSDKCAYDMDDAAYRCTCGTCGYTDGATGDGTPADMCPSAGTTTYNLGECPGVVASTGSSSGSTVGSGSSSSSGSGSSVSGDPPADSRVLVFAALSGAALALIAFGALYYIFILRRRGQPGTGNATPVGGGAAAAAASGGADTVAGGGGGGAAKGMVPHPSDLESQPTRSQPGSGFGGGAAGSPMRGTGNGLYGGDKPVTSFSQFSNGGGLGGGGSTTYGGSGAFGRSGGSTLAHGQDTGTTMGTRRSSDASRMSVHRASDAGSSLVPMLSGQAWTIPSDQITIEERVGGGAFGVVWRGTYAGSPVALKQLFSGMADPTNVAELRVEATLLSQLHHPNVLHFYGICPRGNEVFLVTEFCPASVLSYLMNPNADHGLHNIAALALQVARGMRYLHAKGVIHRDLKPDNLLLTASGHVRVCDFGLARVQASHSMTVNKGTPAYMAPETMTLATNAAGKQYTNAVDVYSFGILLWTMCTRRQPFGHIDNPFAIPAQVVSGVRPAIPHGMPPRMAALIKACWDANPRFRPSFAQVESVLGDPELLSPDAPVASESYDNDHGTERRPVMRRGLQAMPLDTVSAGSAAPPTHAAPSHTGSVLRSPRGTEPAPGAAHASDSGGASGASGAAATTADPSPSHTASLRQAAGLPSHGTVASVRTGDSSMAAQSGGATSNGSDGAYNSSAAGDSLAGLPMITASGSRLGPENSHNTGASYSGDGAGGGASLGPRLGSGLQDMGPTQHRAMPAADPASAPDAATLAAAANLSHASGASASRGAAAAAPPSLPPAQGGAAVSRHPSGAPLPPHVSTAEAGAAPLDSMGLVRRSSTSYSPMTHGFGDLNANPESPMDGVVPPGDAPVSAAEPTQGAAGERVPADGGTVGVQRSNTQYSPMHADGE